MGDEVQEGANVLEELQELDVLMNWHFLITKRSGNRSSDECFIERVQRKGLEKWYFRDPTFR